VEQFHNTTNFFLDIVANKDINSNAILESSSIKLTWASGFVTSLHFKHMVMANYNASNNN
jgi:hypothetical protein